MDFVIRGRSQDQCRASPWDSGRTRVEPGRTGPWGKGGPEFCQADQDQRGARPWDSGELECSQAGQDHGARGLRELSPHAASSHANQSQTVEVTDKDDEPIGERWDEEEEDWGSLEEPHKAHTEPNDWNTDWSSSKKKAGDRQVGRSTSSVTVKKQSSDWSSSGWDTDDSWSNEKEGQGQSSAGEEGWGNDWGEEETDTTLVNETLTLPEGVRLASDYNWDSSSASKGASHNDLFASVSQRNPASAAVATAGGGWGAEATGDWGAEETWESVDGAQGLSKAELSKKKREERRKELEVKRAERKAAKGPLKLGARKLD